MRAVVVAFFVLGASPLIGAQKGKAWRNASWGMTESQVLAAFPGEAVRLEKPDKYKKAIATIGIPTFNVEGVPFKVRFGFANAKLTMINLSAEHLALAQVRYDQLKQTLTEKYGHPLTDRETSIGPEATWKTPVNLISLGLYPLTGLLTVHYTPAASTEENL